MVYLLDTSTVSDLMRGDAATRARVASLDEADELFICTIVAGEVRFGLKRLPPSRRRDDLIARAQNVFDEIPCIAVVPEVADHYASIKHERAIAGLSLDTNDAWIAATARHLGAILVSRDADLSNVPGVIVQDWSK